MRLMRKHGGVPQEKRLALVRLQKVIDWLQSLAADLQSFIAVPSTSRGITMRHACCKSTLGKVAFPPLAGLEADIALLGEKLWQCWRATDMPQHFAAVG